MNAYFVTSPIVTTLCSHYGNLVNMTKPTQQDQPAKDFSKELDELRERGLKRLETEIAEAEDRARRGHATRPPRPRGRTTPIAVRFDEFTIKRLKDLAARRNTGYQTLLKEFVVERLYEEEKRERIIE